MKKLPVKWYRAIGNMTPWLLGLAFIFFVLSYELSQVLLPGYLPYDAKRIEELGLLIGLAGISLLFPFHLVQCLAVFQKFPFFTKIFIIGFFVWGIISSLSAPLMSMAFLEVSLYFLLFYFALFVSTERIRFS